MLEDLLSQSENKNLEFKQNTSSLAGIIKTVVAFANTAGGTLIIGVEDRTKKVVGIENVLNEEERLASAISDSISPFLIPNIEIQSHKNKEIILIEVPHLAGPFFLKKEGLPRGVYVRVGSTNRMADPEQLESLRLYARNKTFDEQLHPRAQMKDLDWEKIEVLFADAKKKINEHKAENLGIIASNAEKLRPTHGGVILFAANRERFFSDPIIRCVRFIGTTKAEVHDHEDIDDQPIKALDQALKFVRRNTRMSAKFGAIKREDIPEYPDAAVREAITNALLHADYAQTGSSIKIAIFDTRMEITNPGALPWGMTLERAIAGSSRVRNMVIARVFRELNIIEQWGSGLQRIIGACAKYGLDVPLFEEIDGIEFKVTLYATKKKTAELDATQQEFVTTLKKRKKISTKEAAQLWDIAPRNARIRLKNLAQAGVIKKVGTSAKDPKGYYTLVSKKD